MESWVQNYWESDIKQSLCDYIEIPSISQQFEANWGPEIEKATEHFVKWINSQSLQDTTCEVRRTPSAESASIFSSFLFAALLGLNEIFLKVIRIGETAPVILVDIKAHGMADDTAPRYACPPTLFLAS